MKYIIASTAVTDEIILSGNESGIRAAGGAGIYALCGIKLWSDEVLLVTGIGQDFKQMYGAWFKKNKISMEGLLVKGQRTPYNVIRYYENGEREENAKYGKEHYHSMEVTADDLKPYFQTAAGIYVFRDTNPEFWIPFLEEKSKSNINVLWEIAANAAVLQNVESVERIAKEVEVFSINESETGKLFGTEEINVMIQSFQKWKIPLVFLRCGAKGAFMITPDSVEFVSSVENADVKDPTGGGNSSSAAVLYGFCENETPSVCGKMGSIAAELCIKQYGVPMVIGSTERDMANKKLKDWG